MDECNDREVVREDVLFQREAGALAVVREVLTALGDANQLSGLYKEQARLARVELQTTRAAQNNTVEHLRQRVANQGEALRVTTQKLAEARDKITQLLNVQNALTIERDELRARLLSEGKER